MTLPNTPPEMRSGLEAELLKQHSAPGGSEAVVFTVVAEEEGVRESVADMLKAARTEEMVLSPEIYAPKVAEKPIILPSHFDIQTEEKKD
jgi:hypothetical protein